MGADRGEGSRETGGNETSLGLSWLRSCTSHQRDHLLWSFEVEWPHIPEWEPYKPACKAGPEFSQHRCQECWYFAWCMCLLMPSKVDKMWDPTARKFSCEDVHRPVRNVTPIVVSAFNSLATQRCFLLSCYWSSSSKQTSAMATELSEAKLQTKAA